MTEPRAPTAAIIDYGLGNLYSVRRACEHAGLQALITSDRGEIESAAGVLLPGVGAFGDAMAALRRLDLVDVLRDWAAADRPLMGICLGVQLLMSESFEFGEHKGLRILEGQVRRFDNPCEGERRLKVPAVGWNRVFPGKSSGNWNGTPLEGVPAGQCMYFVHSYCVHPADKSVVLSLTRYGHIEYCSSVRRGNLFACQFHPERSGETGLGIYRNWARLLSARNNGDRVHG